MSKEITSPIEAFPGTVKLCEPLTLTQAHKYELAQITAAKISNAWHEAHPDTETVDMETHTALMEAWEPGLLACIESADIQNAGDFPAHFPGSPKTASVAFFGWLIKEVGTVYFGESDPNA